MKRCFDRINRDLAFSAFKKRQNLNIIKMMNFTLDAQFDYFKQFDHLMHNLLILTVLLLCEFNGS